MATVWRIDTWGPGGAAAEKAKETSYKVIAQSWQEVMVGGSGVREVGVERRGRVWMDAEG